MHTLLKNKAIVGLGAALPFFALGALFGARIALANEDKSGSVYAQAKIEVQDTDHSSPSSNGKLREVTDPRMQIKQVVKEKENRGSPTTSSSENQREYATGTVREKNLGNFIASLNANRVAALAELKKDREDFTLRMKEWHDKIGTSTKEFKIQLKEEEKISVESTLQSIFNRFNRIATDLNNISVRLTTKLNDLETNKHLDMSGSSKLLATADAELASAKADILLASTTIHANLNASTSATELKAAIKTAKTSLKNAFDAYKDVLQSIYIETEIRSTTTVH